MLTKDEARVGAMTAEEAGVGTYDRALQIQGSLAALISRQSASLEDWTNKLAAMETTRPWMHLPSEAKPYGDVYKWLKAQFTIGGDPLDRDRLVLIIDAYAPGSGLQRVTAFEKAIEQPYVRAKRGGNGNNQHTKSKGYPDNHSSDQRDARRGTSADYLMARLMAAGIDVVAEIGPGKRFETATAAARHYGITKERPRYEVNPSVNVSKAAARIVEVLGTEKAAELVAAMTLILTTNGSD
jgi:hypothetical protein